MRRYGAKINEVEGKGKRRERRAELVSRTISFTIAIKISDFIKIVTQSAMRRRAASHDVGHDPVLSRLSP